MWPEDSTPGLWRAMAVRNLPVESQALTQPAPTLATQGMDLADIIGYRVFVRPPAGQTITGGQVGLYTWSEVAAQWSEPTLKLYLTATSGAGKAWVSDDQECTLRRGRVCPGTLAVTLSGAGTAVDVWIEGMTR